MRLKYIFLLLSCLVVVVNAQPRRVIAFYNVENLMDTHDDPHTSDEDMLPLSDRNWDGEKYQAKLQAISRIIADLKEECDVPALLGLAEVENKEVLSALVEECSNEGVKYEYCHYDSSDERGIDVALLYRSDLFEVQRSQAITPDVGIPTRDMLAVWGKLCGVDVLVFVVHFPSRIGGVKFTEYRRISCCSHLRDVVDSVRCAEPQRRVIIMGDMNDNPNDKSIKEVLGASGKRNGALLYNPFAGVRRRASRGSSVYQGEWNLYDNIIVSADFLESSELRLVEGGQIFRRGYLLDGKRHPLPTYRGVEYCAGVSDHLPVYVILQ
jgi:predicted extracellular nuclease